LVTKVVKMDLSTADPVDIVNALREKLQQKNGKMTKSDIYRLMPPSLKKRDSHNVPQYVPGTLRRQREESQRYLNQRGRPMFLKAAPVPHEVQEEYLNKFYEAKSLGKFSHLPNEEFVKLETEVRTAAADALKHTELEEFLKSIEQEAVVPEGEVNLKDILEPLEDIPPPDKIDMVQAFSADEMPPFPRECPIDRVDSSLPAKEWVEPEPEIPMIPERKRTISETLEALVIATEFAEQNQCDQFIDNLDAFIAHLSCLTTAQDQNGQSMDDQFEVPSEMIPEHQDIPNEQRNGSTTEDITLCESQGSYDQCGSTIDQSSAYMPHESSMDGMAMQNGAFLTEPDFGTEDQSPLIEEEEVQIPPPPVAEAVQHLVTRKMVSNNKTYSSKRDCPSKRSLRPVLRPGRPGIVA